VQTVTELGTTKREQWEEEHSSMKKPDEEKLAQMYGHNETGRRHTGKGGTMRGVLSNRTEKRSTSSILAQAYIVFSLLSITYFLFVTIV